MGEAVLEGAGDVWALSVCPVFFCETKTRIKVKFVN